MKSPLTLALFSLSLAIAMFAADTPKGVHSANTTASLLSDASMVSPGDSIRVGLRLQPDKGWHTYWKNAGDSGFAPSVEWELPSGVSTSELDWPVPRINAGPITNYDYKGDVIHVATLTIPKSFSGKSITIKAAASWLACNNSCVPGDANLQLTIPIAKRTIRNIAGTALFNRRNMPEALPKGWSVTAKNNSKTLDVKLTGASKLSTKTRIVLYEEGIVEPSAAQKWAKSGNDHVIKLARGPEKVPTKINGLIIMPDETGHAFSIPVSR